MPRASASSAATPSVTDNVTETPIVPPAPEPVLPSKPKTMRELLNELRNSDKTLWVKNNTGSIIIIRSDPQAKDRWQNQLNPHDIAILRPEALAEPAFQRLWMNRRVTVSDDETMEDELFLRMGGEIERKTAPLVLNSKGELESAVVTAAPQDNSFSVEWNDQGGADKKGGLVTRQCLLTGVPVFQTKRDVDNGVPPLADHVKDKSYLFIGEQRRDDKTGDTFWVFPKVSIGLDG